MLSPTNKEKMLAHIKAVADELINLAEECDIVVRINCEPLQPLKMGNSKMVAHVEPKFRREEPKD